ncbi:hypothetical protein TRFO_01327 [Tritrichomonas foetus]|uniref:Uncharacterized protein n=1 Tax=Tritrichomonas foetus TaxID=1144522 RepID=A0A1J4KCK6_9EUKA|nr:hypothetical protein TRFO_01327 [Tritrichomonas foetus]|eukprot:OHT07189.1 hypothetical protein TRFO_01327 [Tritrichomonas foetus]
MSKGDKTMSISELQSDIYDQDEDHGVSIELLLSQKESNDKQFISTCQSLNKEIIAAREEIQSLMVVSSGFCASIGTKTQSPVFPSLSPRHQCLANGSISDMSFLTPRKGATMTPKK